MLGRGHLAIDLQAATGGIPGELFSATARRRAHEQTALRPPFAHPAEALLADLLSFHRVRWAYEPTRFVLKRTECGEIAESFTPDFYLPDDGHYLELTTMRQPLVTRKNGKIRRLRELYPDVHIKMLYRRDYERIIETSERRSSRGAPVDGAVVFSASEVEARTEQLAAEIAGALPEAARAGGPLALISIRPETALFQSALATQLSRFGVEVACACLELPRFDPGDRMLRIDGSAALAESVRGRAVLLAAGASSTGLSLAYARRLVEREQPSWLESVCLLDRSGARMVKAPIRFAGFEAPPEFLDGFGLSLEQFGRHGDIVRVSTGTTQWAMRESG
jgi:hypoxanthine-guanine phosphoribosyltransferase